MLSDTQEPARGNAKNECLKNRLISFIERTVDERAGAGGRWHSDLAVFNNLVNLFPRSGSDSFPVALRIRPSKPCDFLDGLLIAVLETVPFGCTSGIGRYLVGGIPQYAEPPALIINVQNTANAPMIIGPAYDRRARDHFCNKYFRGAIRRRNCRKGRSTVKNSSVAAA